ncbi:MAG: tautomerase family protein [Candidatus Bathyarchaeota archaeon]|nr:tautomerase family protein [Candidatus Bathyarchaeota archaeon]
MPTIIIKMFPGRTVEEKKKLAEAITNDVVELLGKSGATREGTIIIFEEVPKSNYARGGILFSEKLKTGEMEGKKNNE